MLYAPKWEQQERERESMWPILCFKKFVQYLSIFSSDLCVSLDNHLIQSKRIVRSWEQHKTCWAWGSHSGDYEEFYLLECDATQSVEGQSMFRKLATYFHAGILHSVFYPEDGDNMFLRNVDFQRITRRCIPTRHFCRTSLWDDYLRPWNIHVALYLKLVQRAVPLCDDVLRCHVIFTLRSYILS
jgi:hypothetical protein